jgi:hypothetical protein
MGRGLNAPIDMRTEEEGPISRSRLRWGSGEIDDNQDQKRCLGIDVREQVV